MPTRTRLAPQFDTPDWQQWLAELDLLCDRLGPESRLRGGRNELLLVERQGLRLAVKRFRNRGLWKKIAYRLATSKARRSFEHSARLIEIGLASPRPVAWREDWAGPWLSHSLYVCEYLAFAHDANAIAQPATEDPAAKAALVGDAVARMHEAHIAHLDLNGGNLLFARDQAQRWQLHIIDNNRMAFGPVTPSRGVGLLVHVGLEGHLLDALLEAYSQARRIPLQLCQDLYARKLKRFHLKWKIKNATRPWRRRLGL